MTEGSKLMALFSRSLPRPFTVRQGKRYRAKIALSWWQSGASNDTVAGKFSEVGFTDVSVTGSGSTRIGEGTWPKPDTTAEMPSEIQTVEELEA
jgi:hypothetical protein